MNDEIRALLEDELKDNFQTIKSLSTKDKAYFDLSEEIRKKCELLNDDSKITADYDIRFRSLEAERDDKDKQLSEQEKERWLKVGTWVIGGLASSVFTTKLMKIVLKFEETGAITSSVGRSLIGSLFRMKK